MIWLACCVLITNALVVGVVALLARRLARRQPPDEPTATQAGLPDFAVIDCRHAIHFVPLPEDGHELGSSRCPCRPSKTVNRRRCGRRVVYLDHHRLDRTSAARP